MDPEEFKQVVQDSKRHFAKEKEEFQNRLQLEYPEEIQILKESIRKLENTKFVPSNINTKTILHILALQKQYTLLCADKKELKTKLEKNRMNFQEIIENIADKIRLIFISHTELQNEIKIFDFKINEIEETCYKQNKMLETSQFR